MPIALRNWRSQMPKVSVIIPVYKSEKYLPACLDSVLAQTFKDFEVICVNDGSPDSCETILNEYSQKDKRIKIINQTNKGQSVARNIGIDNAFGEYLYFVDSDDRLHPQAIEILFEIAEKTNSPITISNRFIKLSKKQKLILLKNISLVKFTTHKQPIKDLLKTKYVSSSIWNKLFKREVFGKWKFIEGINFEDWPLITCIFSEIPFYVSVDIPLYFYNDTDESTVRSPFTVRKIQDYVTGIKFTYNYYRKQEKKKFWRIVQKYRIYQSIKMVLNKVYHAKVDKSFLIQEFFKNYNELHSNGIILLRDFSLKSLYRLVRLYLNKGGKK